MTRRSHSLVFVALISSFGWTSRVAAQATTPSSAAPDRFLWLESQNGERAMAWVKAENAKTAAVLEKDPRFAGTYRDALAVAQASDRIPAASFISGDLYNFWQDSAHVRGIWRRTSLASYRTSAPQWTTVLDLDELTRTENANWVWKGADCATPVPLSGKIRSGCCEACNWFHVSIWFQCQKPSNSAAA